MRRFSGRCAGSGRCASAWRVVRVAGGDGTLAALGFLVQVVGLDVGDEPRKNLLQSWLNN
jgi:hypothetical protein